MKEPKQLSVGSDAFLTAIIQFFIATQLQTNHQLIEYIGKAVAREANNITIGNQTLNSEREKPAWANCPAVR